jgi:methionyl-tRNA formyltransferase
VTPTYRLIFMGTPDFAVPALRALVASRHTVAAAYTQPPRPAGRGQRLVPSAVHVAAQAAGLPVHTPASLKDPAAQAEFAARVAEAKVDLAVVVAYGLILPRAVLAAPPLGCLNIHASLLPRWRGAAPIHRAIAAGDRQTGITIMQMDAGLDTGPMLLQQATHIGAEETTPQLHDRLAELGAAAIVEALDALPTLTPQPQPQDGVTYAHKLTRDEGALDWQKPAAELARQIRALQPWPGSWFTHNGQPIKVGSAAAMAAPAAPPGTILSLAPLTIACGQGALQPLTLQRPGGKPLPASAFLSGYPLTAGEILL